MILRAKYDSWGFLGRSWFEGDFTPDLTEEELKDPSIIHFETLDGSEVIPKIKEIETYHTITENRKSNAPKTGILADKK